MTNGLEQDGMARQLRRIFEKAQQLGPETHPGLSSQDAAQADKSGKKIQENNLSVLRPQPLQTVFRIP